jgi:glycerate kinase
MKLLIAPNAFKRSLSAIQAASIVARSLKEIASDAETILCPIADGGDGTLECLVQATGGKVFTVTVTGPVASLRVKARWGVLGDGSSAVIEMAEAAGLRLLKQNQYDVANATTRGVGELIREALHAGYKKIIIGLGGSATNDGGAGCGCALGARFLDEHNVELPGGGIHLARLHHLQIKNYKLGIKNADIIGLADVTNVLYGPAGAAYTFAAQKGATSEQIRQLDEGLRHYASILERDLHRDVSQIPGSGAAGGLGAGLIAFCNARIISGIDFVLDTIRFDDLLRQCDCVITAEGMIDSQTLRGKGIEGVARRAQKFNKPVHAFVGRIRGDPASLQLKLGLATLEQISPDEIPLPIAMRGAETFLARAIRDFFFTKVTKEIKK